MKITSYPALFFLVVLGVFAVFSVSAFFVPSLSSSSSDFKTVWDRALTGRAAAAFEKDFTKDLPLRDAMKDAWGRLDFDLFQEGRSGVVIGRDGWLFSKEETGCERGWEQRLSHHLDMIAAVARQVEAQKTRLILVPVPAKARIYADKLIEADDFSACRRNVYDWMMRTALAENIAVADPLAAYREIRVGDKDPLFLRTDTHWTPAGAKVAAQTVAQAASVFPSAWARVKFKTQGGESRDYKGDLLRYLPGVGEDFIAPDRLQRFETMPVLSRQPQSEADLFVETKADIVLVGTSYSANPDWNFEGALKEAMSADILNVSDEGKGPFIVMEKYLQSESWQDAPPKLIVWEIPERYLILPDQKDHK